jgi:hypothetical protein
MLENNINNLNKTQLNKISIVIHNVMTKIHYYSMSRTKKSFWRKARKTNESLKVIAYSTMRVYQWLKN